MALVFSAPGKTGDLFLQWPVARWYCQSKQKQCELWLDEQSLKPLVPLFEAQPEVAAVKLIPGIENWSMGGQPYDFNLPTATYVEHEVHHLGFRGFPQRQITLQTAQDVAFHVKSAELSAKPGLVIPDPSPKANRCVLHGTFRTHTGGTPTFWRTLYAVRHDLEAMFDEIVFTGTEFEIERARDMYPNRDCQHPAKWKVFEDHGDWLELARYISASRMMIGAGSSGVALGGLLGVPTVRVHDSIGNAPLVIWSALGEHQWNLSELQLRTEWPSIRDTVAGLVSA